jgi:hypothetical protein
MASKTSQKRHHLEIQIQKALLALDNQEFNSIRAAARFFEVSFGALQRRRLGGVSRSTAQEMAQILTNAEESTLVRWIKRYTITGTPITNAILKELALNLRAARVTHASSPTLRPTQLSHINDKWVLRFQNRHPEIKGIYARQLEYARKEGASYEHVKRWFDAVDSKFQEHAYDPSNVWNMDESGFGVGEEQSMKVLVYLDKATKYRVVAGKQEWVTDIECISAAGEALPPLLIFKGKNVNARWINEQSPEGWHFATSKNGWTSNDLGLEWLKQVFEPLTREKAAGRRRLLIADGHGSHIRGDFIAHCMENHIDLLIMPPHCSHILQPLDVGVFSAFKRYHSVETHAISRLSSQRIPRAEWIELLSRARAKAMSKDNILGGWRGTGLWPANHRRVLASLQQIHHAPTPQASTPCETTTLDLSLLKSSPPDGTELSQSNKKFIESLRECPEVVSPVRRYADRMARMCETQNATIAIMAKQLADQSELLHKRKKAKKGKRIRLEGVSIYTTAEVLRIAREAEAKPTTKRPRGRPRKVIRAESSSEDEAEVMESSSDSSDEEPAKRTRYATRSRGKA